MRRFAGFESPPPCETNNPNTTTMKGSKVFEERIKTYLDQRAAEDPLFAEKYTKKLEAFKSKSYEKNEGATNCIEKCCEYILGEVSASGRCGFDDDEIFGMAVHYFDEDDIEIKTNKVQRVVVNQHIDLTDEEKAEARAKAIADYQNEVRESMKRKPTPKPKEEKKQEEPQLSLF